MSISAVDAATTSSVILPFDLLNMTCASLMVSGVILISRVAVALMPVALIAVSAKLNFVGPAGATKLGVRVSLAASFTDGPSV